MKHGKILPIVMVLMIMLAACNGKTAKQPANAVDIRLSDQTIQVDGKPVSSDPQSAVYAAHDIVYYESGKDFTYGEGSIDDSHTPEEAAAHTVLHITVPGVYRLSGKLSKGQIAVDLGKDAEEDPRAVVTLILDGVDITCEVAPAVIFYQVYECGSKDNPSKDVDTSTAGANIVIADDSENQIHGAYVARIYKPDSVVLNEQGNAVEDAKKLHKYDGAFYSKMSMNVDGEKKNTGKLDIYAENEGMDSEMHLTINGGNIHIDSGNDGINTNEDGVSVTTVNGGTLSIQVTGQTGEGDGIDSNGWLVINGGTVIAAACSDSADAGIDSDMGIYINGGTVIAGGSMLDHIEEGGQTYAVFSFAQKQSGSNTVYLKNEKEKAVLEYCPQNAYSVLVYSSPELEEGTYTLWSDEQQLAGQGSGFGGPGMGPGGMMPPGGQENDRQPPQPPTGQEPPAGVPDGQKPPEGVAPSNRPDWPDGNNWDPNRSEGNPETQSLVFQISDGANVFSGIGPVAQSDGQ